MSIDVFFILNSVLFGVGLAMDAFSVSIANAFNEPNMPGRRRCLIAGTFGFFQIAMPMIGWICVHTIERVFDFFEKIIPWAALLLLLFIGIKMIIEAVRGDERERVVLSIGALIVQGIATSIDALSVGLTISSYGWAEALIESLIIGVVTFAVCMFGLVLGDRVGKLLKNKAGIIGGIILILIGIEIFIRGII